MVQAELSATFSVFCPTQQLPSCIVPTYSQCKTSSLIEEFEGQSRLWSCVPSRGTRLDILVLVRHADFCSLSFSKKFGSAKRKVCQYLRPKRRGTIPENSSGLFNTVLTYPIPMSWYTKAFFTSFIHLYFGLPLSLRLFASAFITIFTNLHSTILSM